MSKLYNNHYINQKNMAKLRGIDWQFTYDTWIEWWGNDIVNKGSRSGQLVMARNGDTGPYHPDNVRKATCNENCSEANKGKKRPRTVEHQAKLNESQRGKFVSIDTRNKLREAKLNQLDTDETRKKKSESIKAWWAARKAQAA